MGLPVRDAQGIVTLITMITTCPACRTAFRIHDEQLAARDGRVRCGRCSTVFDAREALHAEPPAPQSGGPPGFSPPQAEALVFPDIEWIPPAPPVAPSTGRASGKPAIASVASEFPVEPPAVLAPAPRETDAVFPATEPRRARHRAAWTAGSTLLALALVTQIAFHHRGEIALLFPDIRPVLAELCTSLGCDVPLPRRAELISIESSDLQADPANPSVMVLTATLRNRAAFAQSHPSLELTLTDSQDQPLARRVLGVQDYPGRSTDAEAGFAANSELPVKVYMEASSLKATGYRLYLFFP